MQPYNGPSGFVTEQPDPGNIVLASVAGLIAAIVGGILWAVLASMTLLKIGYAAIGVGYLVGFAMRKAGNGRSPVFGYVGAGLALFGCVFGDLLSDCSILAEQVHASIFAIFHVLTPSSAVELLKEGFGVLDVLFYVLAAMAGYRNAFIKS